MLVGAPEYLTAGNTKSALGAQQPGASPPHPYGRVGIERLTSLPLNSVWNTGLTGQFSSDNLLPSEQLVFEGIRSIRGFVELGATREEGVVMQNELRLAPMKSSLNHVAADPSVRRRHTGFNRDHLLAVGSQGTRVARSRGRDARTAD
jgi:Haemolysin secretion/activation protein ShlB/FhaC/HecB